MIAQIHIQNWAALVSALCACVYVRVCILELHIPAVVLDPMYTSVSGSKHFIQLRLEDFRLIGNLS